MRNRRASTKSPRPRTPKKDSRPAHRPPAPAAAAKKRAAGVKHSELAHDHLNTLMDNLPDFVYFKDLDSKFLRISRSQAAQFRLPDPSAAVGKTDFDFFKEEHARQAFEDEQRIIATGAPIIGIEEKETWPDGRVSWVTSTKMPLRNRAHRIVGTFGVSRNITERKQMELELERINTDLADRVSELNRRNAEMSLLNEMGKLLQACRTSEEAHAIVGRQLAGLFPSHSGFLGLVNASESLINICASWGPDAGRHEGPFPPQDCWALRLGRPHLVETAAPHPLCVHVNVDPDAPVGCLCLPLAAQGESLGVLHLRQMPSDNPDGGIPVSQQRLAMTAADHIALALANLNLRETLRAQSIRDALTGLFNRRYLEESLPREISRVRRKGSALGVIMLDLDHFKQFNDVYGHDAGDSLLRTLGQWLQAAVRQEDIVCRFGGEEFVLILPEVTREIAQARAQSICDGIRQLTVRHGDSLMGTVTASLGVAYYPDHGDARDALLHAADAALYQAKRQGRDCVVMAPFAS